MAEYLIQDTTLAAIADAIRLKTGKSEPIPVADMANEISNISVDGGDVVLRYVTFMSYDGKVKYGEKAVVYGDDCADPITIGLFDTPTRESTVQYDFTFAGWASEPNGGVDSTILKDVRANKTVYANFISTLRHYTITFYDDDGTTVLATKSVAYGSVPSYEPTKDNANFDGWTPEIVAVTGNASYKANWIAKTTIETMSWSEIASYAESGEASSLFSVGQTKSFDVTYSDGTTETLDAMIIGFNHDDLADGTGKAGITFQTKIRVDTARQTTWNATKKTWNGETGYNVGGWHQSEIRTTYLKDMYESLPEELAAAIKTVNKLSDFGGKDQSVSTTQDELWLLSASEAFGENAKDYIYSWYQSQAPANLQGAQYEYYTNEEIGIINLIREIFNSVGVYDGVAKAFWLRSTTNTQVANSFTANIRGQQADDSTGILYFSNTYKEGYVSFGFCI